MIYPLNKSRRLAYPLEFHINSRHCHINSRYCHAISIYPIPIKLYPHPLSMSHPTNRDASSTNSTILGANRKESGPSDGDVRR